MRGLTQRLEDARSYRGAWLRPSNFESFWETSVAFAQNTQVESVIDLPSATQTATFKRIIFASTDQTQLSARVILPATASAAEPSVTTELPAVVLFSDLGRGVRSWLHLLRFSALGLPVVAWKLVHAQPSSKTLGGERLPQRSLLTRSSTQMTLHPPRSSSSSMTRW